MNVININRLACGEVAGLADPYVDDELSVATVDYLLRHLCRCRTCRRLIQQKWAAKDLVRQAVRRQPVPPWLAQRVRPHAD